MTRNKDTTTPPPAAAAAAAAAAITSDRTSIFLSVHGLFYLCLSVSLNGSTTSRSRKCEYVSF